MPTYDYRCKSCGNEFEIFHKMTDPSPEKCPGCGEKNSMTKLLSAGAGLQFKGSGFYCTDYRSNTSKTPPKSSVEMGSEKPKKESPMAKHKKQDS